MSARRPATSIAPFALLATLTACPAGTDSPAATASETSGGPGDGEDSSTGDPQDASTGTTAPETQGPTATTVDPDTTDGDSTAGDPCSLCDPLATCTDDVCTCPAGYDGDGTACTDIDECSTGDDDCGAHATCENIDGGFTCACDDGFVGDGHDCAPAESCADDPCDPDASCTDTETGFTCLCDSGFSGNGFDCSDINECNDGSAGCDPHATCSNAPGSYDCACQPGFAGDGFECVSTAPYGAACMFGDDCASGICVGEPYEHCTVECNQAIANDCGGALNVAGFCVPAGDGFLCVGDVDTGNDGDDAILHSGDSATRLLGTLTDVDMFQLDLAAAQYAIIVTPAAADDDVQLEVYDPIGQPLGIVNDVGVGEAEGVLYTTGGGVSFALVRNVGNSTGNYTIEVIAQ